MVSEAIHFCVPLNDKPWFIRNICPAKQVTELDWSDSRSIRIDTIINTVTLTCTPSQHGSSRTVLDRDRSLWCSWTLQTPTHKLFFAGDTAYQAIDTPSAKCVRDQSRVRALITASMNTGLLPGVAESTQPWPPRCTAAACSRMELEVSVLRRRM